MKKKLIAQLTSFKQCFEYEHFSDVHLLLFILLICAFIFLFSNPGLESLELYDNEIEFLSRESFLGLTSLTELDLSDNPIKNISDDAFIGLKNLSRLRLSYTGLTTLNMFQR